MASKTKGGFLPTLLVLAGVLVVGAVVYPTEIFDRHGRPVTENKDPNSRSVDLIVSFEKSPRPDPVHISWGIGEAFTDTDETKTSRWIKTLTGVKPGSRVALTARQSFQHNTLGCEIRVNGKSAHSDNLENPMVENFVVCLTVVP